MKWLAWALPLWLVGAAVAHEFRPARLDLRAVAPDTWAVSWTVETDAAGGQKLRPVLPERCVEVGSPSATVVGRRTVERWATRCAGPLDQIAVRGAALAAGIETFYRIEWSADRVETGLLDAGRPTRRFAVVEAPFVDYLALGVEHILLGPDHLLFVTGLLLLVAAGGGRRGRRLVGAITGFTLGHSVTLTLAALGVMTLPSAPVEACIALSILLLAVELTRTRPTLSRRRPGVTAALFGLVHGLGFAGVLAELGLPPDGTVPALLGFNVGVEIGQLLFVAVAWGLAALALRLRPWPRAPLFGAYALGTVGAFWSIERVAAFWA